MGFNKSEWMREYRKEYISTPIGRASNLISAYNEADRNNGRGKGDLTAQWIVENIFTKPCAHCGKTGWNVIGCNRLDNKKPHTKDNVEPCCRSCNTKLASMEKGDERCISLTKDKEKPCDQIDMVTGEIITSFESVKEAHIKTSICKSSIGACCRGERNKAGNYIWKYVYII